MSTDNSTTASLSDAKNRKTGLRCQLGPEEGDGAAMTWTGIFREKFPAFNARVRPAYSRSPKERRFSNRRRNEEERVRFQAGAWKREKQRRLENRRSLGLLVLLAAFIQRLAETAQMSGECVRLKGIGHSNVLEKDVKLGLDF